VLGAALTLPHMIVAQPPSAADLVVLDAKVVTVYPSFRIAEALAVGDGMFVAVGGRSRSNG
jgi:predicted amidohydrolase YtcJ